MGVTSLLKSLRPLPGGGGLSGVSADCPIKIRATDTAMAHDPIDKVRIFTELLSERQGLPTWKDVGERLSLTWLCCELPEPTASHCPCCSRLTELVVKDVLPAGNSYI